MNEKILTRLNDPNPYQEVLPWVDESRNSDRKAAGSYSRRLVGGFPVTTPQKRRL